ncbi:MAG: hypothetical protein HOM52_13780 [Rhodospirillaceae bacterium]|jgi:hypothetical protein|nr:hypothetical protein [Rhodospirillaceae bacterium]MBT4428026.1 hypothetical protein [Rhodospirillaceae bacterium]MBT5039572.1 hypothetical protein [Rhodospirillaceae bacterium]MBT5676849.1 hypothetical protein [Rhodospirillaceae bacterium]MBT5780297.1 hypothetical protein [Rhodospirillaceae bacterium]
MTMNVIDNSPYADDASIWQKAAHGRTAASLHAESAAALRADSPDSALSLIEMALAGGAIDPVYRCHHATCLKILGRYSQAEKSYWDIIRDHPESVEAMQGLRALYHAVGQCGATPSPARRVQSPRHQTARHWHRKAARQLRS